MLNTSFFMHNGRVYNLVNLMEIENNIFAIAKDYDGHYAYFKYKLLNGRYVYLPFDLLTSVLPQYQTVAIKNIINFMNALTKFLTINSAKETEILNKASEILLVERDLFKSKANLELTEEYFNARLISLTTTYQKKNLSDLLKSDCQQTEVKSKIVSEFSKENKRIPKNKLIYACLMVISFIGLFQCYNVLSAWMADGKKTNNIMNNLLATTEIKEQEVDIEDIYNVADDSQSANIKKKDKYGDDYWDYANLSLLDVNFDELLKKNKDTVGWLYVNNTNINYPFVQGNDNSYYLNRAFDKSKSAAGWLFADYRSDLKNFKRNTVIYGHGRVDQVMFGSLEDVLEKEWYTNPDNHIIKISTPNKNTLWQVFAVYTIPAESYYLTHNFENDEAYLKFLNTIESRSIYDFNVDLDTNDKVLTLSTCLDYNNNRIVLHAKLVKEVNK